MIAEFNSLLSQISPTEKVPLKIVLFGPESTGKSTLAEKLAQAFNTTWNPEFLRYYLASKIRHVEEPKAFEVKEDEVINIAIGQLKSELEIVKIGKPVVFLDTCLHMNLIYADYYFEAVPPILAKAVEMQNYDFFLFCNTDIPWLPDDQRDGIEVQKELYIKMKKHLSIYELPHALVNGNNEERLDNAIKKVLHFFPDLRDNLRQWYV